MGVLEIDVVIFVRESPLQSPVSIELLDWASRTTYSRFVGKTVDIR